MKATYHMISNFYEVHMPVIEFQRLRSEISIYNAWLCVSILMHGALVIFPIILLGILFYRNYNKRIFEDPDKSLNLVFLFRELAINTVSNSILACLTIALLNKFN